ncbi:50S ribosomal protein L15 [Candidatus Kaiserbacteria bacterium]|nr:50S ribosomal protein L15 [Candidatus Kaiserbacteria bacterium]
MATALHTLVRTGARAKTRVGRGGRRGKTAGRGTKGQNARAGRKKRPEMRDIIKKLPKRRGYGKNRGRTVVGSTPASAAISLSRLEKHFEAGATITPKTLAAAGLVSGRGRQFPAIKIVSTGTITKKLAITGCGVSATARVAIEKAGGSVA